jgi:hypothetical protein
MTVRTIYRVRTDTHTFQTTDADTAETHARAGDRVTAVTTADP